MAIKKHKRKKKKDIEKKRMDFLKKLKPEDLNPNHAEDFEDLLRLFSPPVAK